MWKDSGTPEKSQCVIKAKGGNDCWVCVTLHEKRSCYRDEYTHMGSGVLWKIVDTEFVRLTVLPAIQICLLLPTYGAS